MVGRALTATFVPKRPDLDKALTEKGHADGHVGGRNSWPIDMLQKRDVYVANAFSSFEGGPIIGGNLETAIYRNSGTGWCSTARCATSPRWRRSRASRPGSATGTPRRTTTTCSSRSTGPPASARCPCLPGDVVLAKREGVVCIPPVLAELVVQDRRDGPAPRHVRLPADQGGVYTPGQIDQRWCDDMEKDFSKWLNDHIDKLPVPARRSRSSSRSGPGREASWRNRHGRAARS